MKIYFCDLCNESVPHGDLENGRAVMRNGRVICSACEVAMTSPSAASPAPASTGSPSEGGAGVERTNATPGRERFVRGASPVAAMAVALASFALLGTLAMGAFLFANTDEHLRLVEDEIADARREALEDDRSIESRFADEVRRTTDELADARAILSDLRARLEESARSRNDSLARVREDILEWDGRIRDVEGVLSTVERHDIELGRIRDSAASLRTDIVLVGERVKEQRHRQEEQQEAAESVQKSEDSQPEWWPLVGELSSQNSGVRWQAVQSLGATKDGAVAAHLTAMLKDPDIFVRMATARILGDLQAVVGIPALIDALEDPEASVREASVVSLRGVTGQNFRFDPGGKNSERAKRVKAWRTWWEKSADDLLGS